MEESFKKFVKSRFHVGGYSIPLNGYDDDFMTNLPDFVSEEDCKKMYRHADKDDNGSISYKEFTLMCNVPKSEPIPTKMAPTPTSKASKTDNTATAVVNGGATGNNLEM